MVVRCQSSEAGSIRFREGETMQIEYDREADALYIR